MLHVYLLAEKLSKSATNLQYEGEVNNEQTSSIENSIKLLILKQNYSDNIVKVLGVWINRN